MDCPHSIQLMSTVVQEGTEVPTFTCEAVVLCSCSFCKRSCRHYTVQPRSATSEVPPPIRRDNTILTSTEEGMAILEDISMSSSSLPEAPIQIPDVGAAGPASRKRNHKKSVKHPRPKRVSTMTATINEAKALFGRKTGSAKEDRLLRAETKRCQAIPKVKRDNTMKKTAEEAKQFLGQEFLDRIRFPV